MCQRRSCCYTARLLPLANRPLPKKVKLFQSETHLAGEPCLSFVPLIGRFEDIWESKRHLHRETQLKEEWGLGGVLFQVTLTFATN